MPRRVLIIEDDADIAESLKYNLEREGLTAIVASSGEEGLAQALDTKDTPALIILDLMLPGMGGMELCLRLRREHLTRRVPIIIVTARGSETERVAALDLGADDYITKPFSLKELLARIRALMRRAEQSSPETYEDECLRIDYSNVRVFCSGTQIKLTNKEFALLAVLAKNAERAINRQQLLNNVWGYTYYGDSRTLDVHIRRLRQKLGDCADCIETVIGVGYRFIGCSKQ